MSSELFKMMAGIDFKIVQFKGGGPAMIDVMGGHSQILIGTLTMTMPHIKSGKLKGAGLCGRSTHQTDARAADGFRVGAPRV